MATSRVVSGQPLPDRAVRSQAPALAVVARSLTGHNRQLYELATGHNPVSREAPATIRNPQGLLGHDHSGPPWGSSFLHPVAWFTGRQASSNIRGERQAVNDVTSENPRSLPPWIFWCPPFASLPHPHVAPRARLYLLVLAKASAGTPTLTVTIASHEDYIPTPSSRDADLALTTTLTGYDGPSIHVRPGYNRADIKFEGSHSSNECVVVAMALCVRVKRGS